MNVYNRTGNAIKENFDSSDDIDYSKLSPAGG